MADESDRLARLEVMVQHLSSQMDKVAAVVGVITKLQADHDHHKTALGRAFDKIEAADKRSDELEESIAAVENKLNRNTWTATGIAMGATAVWFIVAWFLKNDVVSLLSAVAKVNAGN